MRITADATIAAAAIIMTVTAIIVSIGAVYLSFESGEVGAWLSLSEGAVTESVSLSTLDSLSSSGMGAHIIMRLTEAGSMKNIKTSQQIIVLRVASRRSI